MAVYRIQKLMIPQERTYGKVWNFVKRNLKVTFKPKYFWRRMKGKVGGALAGGVLGGATGAFVGSVLGSNLADLKSYREEKRKEEEQQYEFSKVDNREDASQELIDRAKRDGVVQKVGDSWRIVAIKKRKLWDAHYKSHEAASKALAAYHANR